MALMLGKDALHLFFHSAPSYAQELVFFCPPFTNTCSQHDGEALLETKPI